MHAWRLQAGLYVPWKPEADGSWHSTSLAVAFQPTQPYLGVRDRDGRQIELPRTVRERAEYLEQQLSAVEQARVEEAQRRADLEEQLRQVRAERGE